MNSTFARMICRLIAVTMMMLPFQYGQAGMIGTDKVQSASTAQLDRNVVLNYLGRTQTESELQSLGLDANAARERVAAMTDDEVGKLAGKISAAPAGADGGIALLILVVFFIWYFAFRR